ncbi:MAG: PA14 domain-containing protein [Anaerolineae bacterium]
MNNRRKYVSSVLTAFLVSTCLGLTSSPAVAQNAWYAEFFVNPDLSGAPGLTRFDEDLNFDWGSGSPSSGMPADDFSARWTRSVWFEAGTYRFSHRSDDGLRIWIDDALVLDDWRDQQAAWGFLDHYIPGGTHRVVVEYYEHTGGARVQVAWDRVSGGDVWRGEYFDKPDLLDSSLVRYDAAIDFDWGYGSPDPSVYPDNFSVRWTRTLGFEAGTYRFYASTDDGVRIFVDGQLVVDGWEDQKLPNTNFGDFTLSAGQHTVAVEYYEHGGVASAHVWWKRLGAFRGWEGRYFGNADLRGSPELIRDDPEINFDWGEGAPVPWMPADSFSAVWQDTVYFEPGTYRFNVLSDDGVRVWLDNGLLMDYWEPMDYEYHFVEGVDVEGAHTVRVEYYEHTGSARIRFWWEQQGGPSTVQPAPTPAPTPAPSPALQKLGPWEGEYFDNSRLAGSPVLTRRDEVLDFDWGWGAPTTAVGRDNFSVRWTGTFDFPAGRHCFSTTTDDGIRVYVDGQTVIDSWYPMRGMRTGCTNVSAGAHEVRVEYFEQFEVANVLLTVQ